MADAQAPVEAAVPAAQALVQVPPVAAANLENPQQNPAPLQVWFLLVLQLSSSLAGVRPFAFPSPLSSTWLLVCTVFFDSFSSSRFYFFNLLYAYISQRPIWSVCSVLVSFCTPFFLSCQCASPRKHRVCVVLFSSAPFSLAHVLFVIWVCFASRTPSLCSASPFSSPLPCTRFIFHVSVPRLANTGFV